MARYLENLNECTDPTTGDFLHIYDASAPSNDKDRKVAWPILRGTWTPEFADAVTGGNTASFGSNNGLWLKIGPLVLVVWRCTAITTTGMNGGATMYIRGLPYSINSTNPGALAGSVRLGNVAFNGYVTPGIFTATVISLFQSVSGTGGSNLLVSSFTSGSANCIGSILYATNE